MPWSKKDVGSHYKGASDKQARAWVAAANSTLKACESRNQDDCEGRAVRAGNAAANAVKEAERVRSRLDLIERGRVLSAENEATLRSAVAEIESILAKLVSGEDVPDAAQEAAFSAALLAVQVASHVPVEESQSYREREQQVRAALQLVVGGKNTWVWIVDLYDDKVIYEMHADEGDGYTYAQRSYAIVDGEVTFGDPTTVQRQVVYVAAEGVTAPFLPSREDFELAEGSRVVTGELVPLIEKAVNKDGMTPLKLIAPGWGSSAYYSEDLLAQEGPVTFPAGTHMYWDHPTEEDQKQRPERSLRDLAAVIMTDPVWDKNGPQGPGLYANARVFKDYAEKLDEIGEHIGVSIRATGWVQEGEAEGMRGPILTKFGDGLSVDFVTVPGAGGKVLQVFESARGSGPHPIVEKPKPQPAPVREKKEDDMTDEQFQALQESIKGLKDEVVAVKQENARLKERFLLDESRTTVTRVVEGSRLPKIAHSRVIDAVAGDPPLTEAGGIDHAALRKAAEDAVKREIAYIGEAAGMGPVRGMNSQSDDELDLDGEGEYKHEDVVNESETLFTELGLTPEAAKLAAAGRI